MFDITTVTGIGDYTARAEVKGDHPRTVYLKGDKAFLVVNPNTIELRTDRELARHLTDKYESVMASRYFGNGGIEIVLVGQLSATDLADLTRLSYNLTEADIRT